MSVQLHGAENDAPREVCGARSITVVCPAEIGLSFHPIHHEAQTPPLPPMEIIGTLEIKFEFMNKLV
jgi:hypothetical protein